MKDNNCVYYFNDFKAHSGPITCDPVWTRIQDLTSNLNWYDLYRTDAPPLSEYNEADRIKTVEVDGKNMTYKSGRTVSEYTPWLKKFIKNDRVYADILSTYVNS